MYGERRNTHNVPYYLLNKSRYGGVYGNEWSVLGTRGYLSDSDVVRSVSLVGRCSFCTRTSERMELGQSDASSCRTVRYWSKEEVSMVNKKKSTAWGDLWDVFFSYKQLPDSVKEAKKRIGVLPRWSRSERQSLIISVLFLLLLLGMPRDGRSRNGKKEEICEEPEQGSFFVILNSSFLFHNSEARGGALLRRVLPAILTPWILRSLIKIRSYSLFFL